ncbi:MAG: hypothetical protein E6J90_37785 [Deltaproteobacteria bacterium]|nr:MAG: hypothetical protein E6J90_37785 [Deltaproteobacteria bacterium]
MPVTRADRARPRTARRTTLDDTVQILDRASLDGIADGVGAATQWVDLDGEGIPGVLRADERGWYYKANLGDGRLAPPAVLRPMPMPADLSGGFQQLADVQSDGRLELVRYAQPVTGYFTRTTDGAWDLFTPLRSVPSIDWADPNLRTIDLDGDGHADVLITEHDAFVWYRSLAEVGFEPARRVNRVLDEEKGPAIVFADVVESIYLADMTGDGLVDIVRVRNGDVCYWPNLGHGRFGAKITMDRSPVFDRSDLFDPKRVRFADVDGSGPSDLLYLGRDGVAIHLNQSGNGFAEPQVIRSLPLHDTLSSTTVIDLRGRGTSCLVWSSPAPAPASSHRPLAFVDLMGGVKPHLLVSIKNNLGAETRISYASSTQFYLADKAAGTPWITRLPFPVHVVERVTTFDRISRNRFVTRYTYHHGHYDGVEREFRGFGRVDQLDTEELGALTASGDFPAGDNIDAASFVPPVLSRTWFHTGVFFEGGRVSKQLEAEYHAEPGLADELRRAMLLDDTVLPPGLSANDQREACRALKGSILRREVYAIDGTEAEPRPYLASERNYTLVPIQPRGDGRYAIFFAHPREAIEFHYERKLYDVAGKRLADPRVTHSLTLDVDDFGNVLRSVDVGYGRRRDSTDPVLTAADRARQRELHVTSTTNAYSNAIDDDVAYRAPLPCESRTYEITRLPPLSNLPDVTNLFGFDEMVGAIDGLEDGAHDLPYEDLTGAGATQPHPYRRLIEHARTLYRRDDLSAPLAFGHAESRALPFESYKLALTPGLITAVYGDRVTDAMLAGDGGYVHSEGDANWWIPSGRAFYSPGPDDTAADELAHARQHFFLPHRFRDPFGQTTTVSYDRYDLLVSQTRDPIGNLVTVGAHDATGALVDNGNDYRVLQPARIMDPNRNRKAVAPRRLARRLRDRLIRRCDRRAPRQPARRSARHPPARHHAAGPRPVRLPAHPVRRSAADPGRLHPGARDPRRRPRIRTADQGPAQLLVLRRLRPRDPEEAPGRAGPAPRRPVHQPALGQQRLDDLQQQGQAGPQVRAVLHRYPPLREREDPRRQLDPVLRPGRANRRHPPPRAHLREGRVRPVAAGHLGRQRHRPADRPENRRRRRRLLRATARIGIPADLVRAAPDRRARRSREGRSRQGRRARGHPRAGTRRRTREDVPQRRSQSLQESRCHHRGETSNRRAPRHSGQPCRGP